MKENKQKFALWIYPSVLKKVDKLYKDHNCRSRSEFIERAVLFYCGYLAAEDYGSYLPHVLTSTLQAIVQVSEDRISRLLFRDAVEISMMANIIAATNDIDPELLSELRGTCVRNVSKTHGSIMFEEAYRFQHEDTENV